jgi:hypothetical protein
MAFIKHSHCPAPPERIDTSLAPVDGWTKNRPVTPGFYWVRNASSTRKIEIKSDESILSQPSQTSICTASLLDYFDPNTEWNGPVSA